MKVTNCVLVTLNISVWDANRQDRRVSALVADANEVKDKRLCRLRKSLLPKTEVMDRVFAVIRAARTFHYENTHAWMHDGPRILPTSNFDAYMKQMRAYKADFEAAVLDFLAQYDDIRKEAEGVLGKLYDAADYPDGAYLRRRYDFDMKVQPMPASGSLLELGLQDAEAEAFQKKLEADMAETFQRANRRMWEELYERLEKLYSKLADEKSHVRPETLAAVQELSELLPRMNITNDEKLDALAMRLKSALAGLSTEALKHDAGARERAAADTQKVFNVMQSFMNPARGAGLGALKRAA